MKKFSPTQINLLKELADGLCHSGNHLGLTLGISRTAVWKQIRQMTDLGVPIATVPQQGYRLITPIILLDEACIRQALTNHDFHLPLNFHLFASIDSTNRFLKELPEHSTLGICCAEQQTQGRGRFGRHWHSPFGENIYFSSRWQFDCDLSQLSGMSLVVSLAILASLNELGIDDKIGVKWPNDLLWQGKKLCGSLIEISAESNGKTDVVIGIGLNVNSITEHQPPLEKPWCSLYDITGKPWDRNRLIAQLIIQLHAFLQRFLTHGFSFFQEQWQQADCLKNQMIRVNYPLGFLYGKAIGVNDVGQLILEDETGEMHYLSSGDTSLHAGE
ncbi:biotin--[acetyl-CoA-carboxylase] ligase [Legionella oakridgensis]|uniref:biotin--[acetyl-CoA-carboxylase] ligase n=1 Tax=Legionella oakridgensis TaxID=29423 RepID=UPI0003DE5573|nr:biotin--[acetyl-CoA-carboxylase] ligase [Legionella oakridgensis]ETO93620.1 birA, biotin-[acetyl-CoA-carboxylase] ligase region [Legionella oakridgensis RV-2-2007]